METTITKKEYNIKYYRQPLVLIPSGVSDNYDFFENGKFVGRICVCITYSDYFDWLIEAPGCGNNVLAAWHERYAYKYKNKPVLALPLNERCEKWLAKSKYFEYKNITLKYGSGETFVLKMDIDKE